MKINPVPVAGTDREQAIDFCFLFHPIGPKVKPWFKVYTLTVHASWAIKQIKSLDIQLQTTVVIKTSPDILMEKVGVVLLDQELQRAEPAETWPPVFNNMLDGFSGWFFLAHWMREGKELLSEMIFSWQTTLFSKYTGKIYLIV